jgi:alpha-tubulin suppressor-like RCC1 family protein
MPTSLRILPLLALLAACSNDDNDTIQRPTPDLGADMQPIPDAAPDADVPDTDLPDAGQPDLDAPDADLPDADLPDMPEDSAPDLEPPVDPTLTILAPADRLVTRRFDVPVQLATTDAASLTVSLNGDAPIPVAPGADADSWTAHLIPAPGQNTATFAAEGRQGQRVEQTLTFTFGAPISAGAAHSAAIRDAGLLAWGRNNKGQVGLGAANTTANPTPTVIAGPPALATVAFSQNASLAVATDGSVWAWGDGANGQLGLGTSTDGTLDTADQHAPVQLPNTLAVTAARGYRHSMILKADGTVWTFGVNDKGQLGDGTTESRDRPTLVPGLSDVVAISAGSGFSLALRRDGTLWAWGDNSQGQLGLGVEDAEAHPAPVQVPGLSDLHDIAAGKDHILAITAQGQLYAWGLNQSGQVGDGTSGADADAFAPKPITLPAPVRAVFANANFSFAILTDGAVYGWGQNFNGQLGLGMNDTTEQPAPVLAAVGLVDPVWLALGATHTLAMTRAGSVWSWGWHFMGALGHTALEDRWTQTSPLELTFP